MFTLKHGLASRRVEEVNVVVGGVLCLDEVVELRVLRRLLAEDRVAVGGRIRGEVLREMVSAPMCNKVGEGRTGGVFFSA